MVLAHWFTRRARSSHIIPVTSVAQTAREILDVPAQRKWHALGRERAASELQQITSAGSSSGVNTEWRTYTACSN